MEFREAVQEIIESVPSGMIFDSHFVINQLIKNFSNEYINFTAAFANKENSTLTAHGSIGKVIAEFEGRLVAQQANESWSENIHGNASDCALWKRI